MNVILLGAMCHPLCNSGLQLVTLAREVHWQVLYRLDDESAFQNLRDEAAFNAAEKRKRQVAVDSVLKTQRPPIRSSVLAVAQLDHFTKCMQYGKIYSLPQTSQAELQSFGEFFDSTDAQYSVVRRRRAMGGEDDLEADATSFEPDPYGRVFFKLAVARLGHKRTVPLAPAAGRKLKQNDLTVIVTRSSGFDESEHTPTIIDSAQGQKTRDAFCVLSDLGDPADAAAHLLEWSLEGGMLHSFYLTGSAAALASESKLSELATSLVKHNAFFSRDKADWLRLEDDWRPVVEALQDVDLVDSYDFHGQLHVCLSRKAVHGDADGDRLIRLWRLKEPRPALRMREAVALENRTSMELMLMLENDGFEWKNWVPPARRKKDMVFPISYTPGDAKIFFSVGTSSIPICSNYMMCLLKAEDSTCTHPLIFSDWRAMRYFLDTCSIRLADDRCFGRSCQFSSFTLQSSFGDVKHEHLYHVDTLLCRHGPIPHVESFVFWTPFHVDQIMHEGGIPCST